MFKFIKIVLFIGFLTALSIIAAENPGKIIIEWFDVELRSTAPVFIIALMLIIFAVNFLVFLPMAIVKKIFSRDKKSSKKPKNKEPIGNPKALEEIASKPKETVALVANTAKDNLNTDVKQTSPALEILPMGFVALQTDDINVLGQYYRQAANSKELKNSYFTKLLEAYYLDATEQKEEAIKIFNTLYLLQGNSEISLLASRKIIEHAMATKNIEKAFMIASKIYEQKDDVKWILDINLDLQIEKKLWKDALSTLDKGLNKKLFSEEKHKKLKAIIFYELAKKEENAGDTEEAMKYAITANETDPSFVAAAILTSSFYASRGMDKKAAGVLSRNWRIRPVPDIAHAYVKIWKDETVFEQVQRVEQLALANNKHPMNDLITAEYNIKAGLWGPAKKHLDIYMSKYPTNRKLARMMAEFEEGGNKDLQAAKEWLIDAENAEPDQMWICSKCYGQPHEWETVCPYCGSFATIEWLTPGRNIEQEIEFEKSGMKN